MPTYVVRVKPNQLTDGQKDDIAQFITKTHTKITGAPNYFAQVIFQDEPCRRYVGGALCDAQIWIRGDIRAGRSVEQRSQLVEALMHGVAELAGVEETNIWVYLNQLEATDMGEYGRILSEPGQEDEWFSSLPEAVQKCLMTMPKL